MSLGEIINQWLEDQGLSKKFWVGDRIYILREGWIEIMDKNIIIHRLGFERDRSISPSSPTFFKDLEEAIKILI